MPPVTVQHPLHPGNNHADQHVSFHVDTTAFTSPVIFHADRSVLRVVDGALGGPVLEVLPALCCELQG